MQYEQRRRFPQTITRVSGVRSSIAAELSLTPAKQIYCSPHLELVHVLPKACCEGTSSLE